MNATEQTKCQRCGAVIPTASAERLCPACLLSAAMEPPGNLTETVSMVPRARIAPNRPTQFPCEIGDYRLLGPLGRGGMGTVYEAEQRNSGRRLAVKMLGQQLDSPEMRQRFLREGRLAARVNHPNSLFIFGSEEVEGHPLITMEIAPGGTLKDKLKERGPLPVAEAVDAALDVIAGLESAYAHGILHRDIKPSNCFISPDGSIKVGDYGLSVSTLAKTDTFVTAHGKILGTPTYASPEQLRGDTLDVRADIYSVGATLYTLLTDRAPFEGDNAVQVVANVMNQVPAPLSELRTDVPPGLDRVVARCLAKEPDERYAGYAELRNVLLPFSSKEPEPASMTVRASAGWIDFLIAFLPAYVTLMLTVGAEQLLVRPMVERTLYSARYYLLLLGLGFLYFTVTEGIWGAGLGKWLKGLRVIRANGRPPGLARALIRIAVPILCAEGVRMPLMMALMPDANWTGLQTAIFVISFTVCGWIPVLLTLRARRENGFATVWDLASGTRVVIRPKGALRPALQSAAQPEIPADGAELIGPYQVIDELVPGGWIVAADPALRRHVWLLRRTESGPSEARRNVARPGRPRWLQKVVAGDTTWDAYEASPGAPFSSLVGEARHLPWATLRHWFHDLAAEIWAAAGDETLPAELSLDHVWITADGRAALLDAPWPGVESRAQGMPVRDVAGQQRFLDAIAGHVDATSLPLHARGVLRNLAAGKFEKLSFLTGTFRGLLDRPAEVSRGIRAGAVFLLPAYVWIAVFVGRYHDRGWDGRSVILSVLAVLGAIALAELLAVPFGAALRHGVFRLAVVNSRGERASRPHLLARWAITWLPLLLPASIVVLLSGSAEGIAFIAASVLLLLWGCAAVYAVIHPHRGLHDRLAGTWVVRR